MKNFAIKHYPDNGASNLTPDERKAIGTLRSNKDIVIQRPDKGGGVVVLDREYYNNVLSGLIGDTSKFVDCSDDQTHKVKKKINSIAAKFKEENKALYDALRRVGEYNAGFLYGLPKLHKNTERPPLRPIISMIGTVTHDVAQYFNDVIRPYLDSSYIVKSNDELLLKLESLQLQPGNKLCSLDVESLFSNVPVRDTIEIIITAAYHHETLPPPNFPKEVLRDLLSICTTETPFSFLGKMYLQRDGVSMGSPLGPTFADFYMSALESQLLNQQLISNPVFYVRYVDDILALFKTNNHIHHFVRRLKSHSILNFTTEIMTDNSFNFLDVKFDVVNGKFVTSVFIKPTDRGTYANFMSHSLYPYKISVIKSLVHRAMKLSSNWNSVHTEIARLRQVFVNNGYPQTIIDKVIETSLNRYLAKHNETNKVADVASVTVYVEFSNVQTFSTDNKVLTNIIKHHVKPINDYQLVIKPYYRPCKLASCFSTKQRREGRDRFRIVYKFVCPEERCNASYIGYTTNTLLTRCKQHRYSSSSIKTHFSYDHLINPPAANILINNFEILYSSNNVNNLKIAESLLIKEHAPFINVKYNDDFNVLHLF